MSNKVVILNLFWLLILVGSSLSLENPIYPVDRVLNEELIVEYSYSYVSRHYVQPLEVEIISKNDISFSSPEKTLFAIISGMIKGDISWVLDCYDSESKSKLEEIVSNDKLKQSLLSQWESSYGDVEVYLLRWVDANDFVILEYEVVYKDGSDRKNTLNFINIENEWKATNAYSDHPVSNYLGEERIKLHGN